MASVLEQKQSSSNVRAIALTMALEVVELGAHPSVRWVQPCILNVCMYVCMYVYIYTTTYEERGP